MSDRELSDAKNGISSRKSYGFRDPVVRNVVDKFVERNFLTSDRTILSLKTLLISLLNDQMLVMLSMDQH